MLFYLNNINYTKNGISTTALFYSQVDILKDWSTAENKSKITYNFSQEIPKNMHVNRVRCFEYIEGWPNLIPRSNMCWKIAFRKIWTCMVTIVYNIAYWLLSNYIRCKKKLIAFLTVCRMLFIVKLYQLLCYIFDIFI